MKIVVLGGGISTERDVSLSSSRMIYKALKDKGHQAVLLDVYPPARNGGVADGKGTGRNR